MANQPRDGYNPQLDQAFAESRASRLFRKKNKPEAFDNLQRKMVRGDETDSAIEDRELITNPQSDMFIKNAIGQSMERIRDNDNILQLLPDMKLGLEIIIGTILSPKDFMQTTLSFSTTSHVFAEKAGPLLKIVQDYFITSYKIKEQLSPMLWDILAKRGSYPLAILPETAVDDLINNNSRVTLESLKEQNETFNSDGSLKPLGLLGDRSTTKSNDDDDLNLFDLFNNISQENGVFKNLTTKWLLWLHFTRLWSDFR
ncbi:MAG: hypothetical protein [Bacteriophage sp.]|nr:MAG: hypothetical protein [Bacteriophage sp.]